jgi:hypothetical protein
LAFPFSTSTGTYFVNVDISAGRERRRGLLPAAGGENGVAAIPVSAFYAEDAVTHRGAVLLCQEGRDAGCGARTAGAADNHVNPLQRGFLRFRLDAGNPSGEEGHVVSSFGSCRRFGGIRHGAGAGQDVNVYNWNDYIDPKVLEEFTRETGIKVVYDTYDNNEIVETKMLTGKSGYDIVVPSGPFLQRLIAGRRVREARPQQAAEHEEPVG